MFRKAAGHADLAFWAGEQESTMLMKPSTTHYLRRIKSGLSARGEWSSAMRLIGQAGRLFNSPRHDMDSSRTNGSPLIVAVGIQQGWTAQEVLELLFGDETLAQAVAESIQKSQWP